MRQSTTSALPSSVRVAQPGVKKSGCRSSGQPAASTSGAFSLSTAKAAYRWLTSTSEWCRPSSALKSGESPAGATRSHSSGPRRAASRSPVLAARLIGRSRAKAARVTGAGRRSDQRAKWASLSTMQERERGDLGGGEAVRRSDINRLADARAAAGEKRHGDRAPAIRAVIARGDVAERSHWRALARVADELGAFVEHESRVLREEADELLAVCRAQIRSRERALADEVALGRADHRLESEVVRGHRAVGLLAHDDEAALGAQHVHGFGSVRSESEPLCARAELLPERRAFAPRHVDLAADLAGEGHAKEPARDALERPDADAHVAQAVQFRDEERRLRSLDRDDRVLLGDARQVHLQIIPFGLQVILHVGEHARRAARGGGDVEAIRREAGDDAVVVNVAVFTQHERVAAASRREPREVVHVHAVQELARIAPDDFDLAQRGSVEQT